MKRFTAFLAAACAFSTFIACSGNENNSRATGGASSQTGGATATGGSATGGTRASGGSGGSSSGGTVSTGGTAMSGGSSTTGGTSTGGTGTAGSTAAGNGGASGSAGAANGGNAGGGVGGTDGGSGGSGGAVELKLPIERNGKYVLEFGKVLLEVDPKVGARVTTFSLDGKNLLGTQADDHTNQGNYGSTFWPSPQTKESWGGENWPPIPEIDNQAYTPSVDGNTIVMTQPAPSARGKILVIKRFTPVLNAQAVDVEYTMTNKDTTAVSRAPWEISRVPAGGIYFFPTGNKEITEYGTNPPLPTSKLTKTGGVTWYQNQSGDAGKYSADGKEGWLAQATSKGVLFVKRYTDVPADQAAPNEADTEFYAGDGYVEIEPQGAYQSLQAGASVKWTVRWYVRTITDTSIVTVGNAALVSMVRDVIKE